MPRLIVSSDCSFLCPHGRFGSSSAVEEVDRDRRSPSLFHMLEETLNADHGLHSREDSHDKCQDSSHSHDADHHR